MISNVLDQFLNESTTGYDVVEPMPSNEGFEFEFGGVARINALAEAALDELTAIEIANEVKCCKMLAEGADDSQILVLQENVITSMIDGAKKILQKLWARMKSICQSVKLQFEKIFNTKGFIRDAEKILKHMTDFSDLELEGYNFTLNDVNLQQIAEKMIGFVKGIASESKNIDINSLGINDTVTIEQTREKISSKSKPIMEKLGEGETRNDNLCNAALGCNFSDLNSTIFKTLRGGKDTEETVSWNKDACLKALKEFSSMQNTLNSVSKDVDLMFKKATAELDDMKKLIDIASDPNKLKDNAKEVVNARKNVINACAKALTESMTMCNTISGAKLQALKDQASQSKRFISKAISQGKKNASSPSNVNASTDITDSVIGDILDRF